MSLADTQIRVPDDIARAVVVDGAADTAERHRALAWLRENAPLARVEVEGYDPLWLVTTHADVLEVERRPGEFSAGGGDRPGTHNPHLVSKEEDELTLQTSGSLRSVDSIEYADGAEHAAMKEMSGGWFRPVSIRGWNERIREIAQGAIGRILPDRINSAAAVEDFCLRYPLHIILGVLGEGAEKEELFLSLVKVADDFGEAADAEDFDPAAAAEHWGAVFAEIFGYFDEIIDDRRANPREDFATTIALAKDPATGDYYPRSWAHGWYISLITAGHATTSDTLRGTLRALAENPDQLALVQADPTLVPDLVDEGLRWVSPIKHFTRRAEVDAEVNGVLIPAGERVVVLFPSGNRDDKVFENPYTFDVTRKPNRHVAFGFGMHQCIGQHLAKAELTAIFRELLPRVESIVADDASGAEGTSITLRRE